MRLFPFKTLLLCVLLPPLVYVFSIQALSDYLQKRYDSQLAVVSTGDTHRLFDGSLRLQEAIRENVDAFLARRKMIRWGVRVTVTIRTKDGAYLYPDGYSDSQEALGGGDTLAVARENFRLLSEGLIRRVDVEIGHDTPIAIAILFLCIATGLTVFFLVYRFGVRRLEIEERARQEQIEHLESEKVDSQERLERLESQRVELADRIEAMKKELSEERRKASATEDEMMDELVAMEEKVDENLAAQDRQLQEIEELKLTIRQFEKENEIKSRQVAKGADAVKKRFGTLYKNIAVHDRAVTGFVDLTEEMKIKAEEVVHQLNDDPRLVQIKRKVFGKKNRETVFEVIFAYKGRLYFRNTPGNRAEVLVIGTKLSQNKDLAFLDSL